MPLRPLPQTSRESLIRSLAIKNNLDPAAVLSVAAGEGGFVNRTGDVGDLAGGGSYGPFQLYAKGALPAQYRGRPEAADQWAWSPAGIQYALGKMAASGAAGLKGSNAVNTIVRKFERPYDPDSSVTKALARYGGYNSGGSAQEGSSLPRSAAPGVSQAPSTPAYEQSTPKPAIRNTGIRDALVQGLIAGQDIYDILPTLPSLRASEPAPTRAPLMTQLAGGKPVKPAPVPSEGHPSAPQGHPVHPAASKGSTTPVTGFVPAFQERLDALIAASKGRLSITSGFRSPEHQATLYAAALKKYGSEHEARRWVAPPGKSQHGFGKAADLGGDLAWAKANAAKFGLHFPLSNEAWHIELAGSR